MSTTEDYLRFPGHTTVEQVLRTYVDRDAQWWWLLLTERERAYFVCSFGSLLPYLTGRTPHIVHNIGHCAICSAMNPLLWQQTGVLVEQALADDAACARLVASLPMAELLTIESRELNGAPVSSWVLRQGRRVCGVFEEGALSGLYVAQMSEALGGMPHFERRDPAGECSAGRVSALVACGQSWSLS